MREILRERDFSAVFGFLVRHGWSRTAITAATGLSETRVRAVLQGKQRVTSYEVLERIADGLHIERGLVGLAFDDQSPADRQTDAVNPGMALGNGRRGPDSPRAASGRSEEAQAARQPAVAVPQASPLFQLPPDIADFTGRGKVTAELTARLTEEPAGNAVVVCVVSGKGGVGKTALAVHVAHGVQGFYPDGQLYVDLRGVQSQPADPGQVLGRFLNELGLDAESIPEQTDDRARLYRAQLASRAVLVVLDNAADERQVRPLLPGNPRCAVVVTSRRRLIGLDSAYQMALDVMAAEQAREMLAGALGVDRAEAEPEACRAIVRYCGRLPLALRIAGARLASRPRESLASYARRLHDERHRLDLLRAGDLEVRTTFTLSYESCDEELRRAFRLLGSLDATTHAPWVLAALADVSLRRAEDLLEQLVDVELVEIAADDAVDGRRYRLHDLLRVFARECLLKTVPEEERRSAVERMLGAHVSLGSHAAALLEPGGLEEPPPASSAALESVRRDPRAWFQAERASFVGGVRLAFDLDLWDLSWRLAELLPALFRWQSDWMDWADTHQVALEAAQHSGNAEGEGRIRCNLGLLYRAQGRFADAMTEFEHSRKIFTDLGDELRLAVAGLQLGDTYRYTGGLDDGVAVFTASLRIFERHRSSRMSAGALNGLGDIYRGLSRWEESTDCFRRSIGLYESLGDDLAVARTKIRFGMVYRDRCLYRDAEALYLEGLTTVRRLNDRRWEARILRHLGVVHRNTGRIATALTRFEEAQSVFAELADHRGVAVTTRNIGDAHRYAGNLTRASDSLSEALRRFQDLVDIRWIARTQIGLADVRTKQEDWTSAHTLLGEALATFDKISDIPGQARALRSWGILHRDRRQWLASVDAFERSESLYSSLNDQIWVARAAAGRGATLRLMGDESWQQVRRDAEDACRVAGAGTAADVKAWLHEW